MSAPRRRARYVPTREVIHIEGTDTDVLLMDRDHTFSALDDLRDVSVSSLASAMRDVYRDYAYEQGDHELDWIARFSVRWSLDPAEDFDDDLSNWSPVALALTRRGQLVIEVMVGGPEPRSEDDSWPAGEALLSHWLIPRRGEFVQMRAGELGYRGYWVAWFSVPVRGLTVADIEDIGIDAITMLDAHDDGVVTIDSLTALLRAGRATALIGLPESQLLEAKRHLHLGDERSELELAKDVSAIANSATGGLLVVGLETSGGGGGDRIKRVVPLPDSRLAKPIRRVIERRIYPPIEGLEVEAVPADADEDTTNKLVMVVVPTQPAELRPFLVSGAATNGKVVGTLIGLYERRGEDVIARGPASIHAALSAGLALLRRPTEQLVEPLSRE